MFFRRISHPKPEIIKLSKLCLLSLITTINIASVYLFMEWIFFITKPSFMELYTFGTKINILFSSLFVIILILGLVFAILFLVLLFPFLKVKNRAIICAIPSSLILSSLALILFDNFTYTVFHFGIITSNLLQRLLYLLSFLLVFFILIMKRQKMYLFKDNNIKIKWMNIVISASLFLISSVFFIFNFEITQTQNSYSEYEQSGTQPNILLISDDGMNASNMSLYSYERETTPFLNSLAPSSLLMENNFSNANTSTGSDTSLLTGKFPFTTGVLYPPNTLTGDNAYEHLPGILKSIGYKTISLGINYFLDVGEINFMNGFDSINCSKDYPIKIIEQASKFGFGNSSFFLNSVIDRLKSRILYLFFIRDIENPLLSINASDSLTVKSGLDFSLSCLENSLTDARNMSQPLFAHIHLLSTHGPFFFPEIRKFSTQGKETTGWMIDYYDDAILNYDYWLKSLVLFLKENNLYENTIIVIYSDHAAEWTINKKIPLMIHFPKDENKGIVSTNTQNLDIAPTILDYLQIEIPEWMEGKFLLGELDQYRLHHTEMELDLSANIDQIPNNQALTMQRVFRPGCRWLPVGC